MRVLRVGDGDVVGVSFAPSSDRLFAEVREPRDPGSTLVWYDSRADRVAARFFDGAALVAVSPDHSKLCRCVAEPDGAGFRLQLMAPDGPPESVRVLDGHLESVSTLTFAPDAAQLLVGHCYRERGDLWVYELYRYEVASARLLGTQPFRGAVTAVTVGRDGRLVAVGGTGGVAARLWTLPEWRSVGSLGHQNGWPLRLAFAPDGSRLAGVLERAVHVWDVATRTLIGRVAAGREVVDVAFSPDGLLLAAGSDGLVQVWEPASWELRRVLDWNAGPLHSLAVAPDGLTIAAGASEGRIVVWDWDEC